MIIWLASYPKSGNTWVRLFLNTLLYTDNELNINNIKIEQFPNKKHFKNLLNNFSDAKKVIKNCLNAQYALNLDNKLKIFKTHSAFWKTAEDTFTNIENTLGVIHIVRDPRNVITSIKNHYGKNSYKESLDFMINEKKFIGAKNTQEEFDIPTLISSWSNHYNSWKKFKKNYLLIKYEDLLNNPNTEFFKITKYLSNVTNLNFDNNNIKRVVKDCNFENLKNQEDQMGFLESPKNLNKKFFFLGPKNNWKNFLNENIKKKIEDNFKEEMKDLKYL